MNENLYHKYAKLLLTVGINLQKNQILYLQSGVEYRDLALVVTEEAFKMGAKDVIIEWSDQYYNHLRAKYCDVDTLREVHDFEKEAVDFYLRQGAAQLGLRGTYPDLMSDIEADKARALFLHGNDLRNVIRAYIHKGILQWTGTALPTKEWAVKVYPELDEQEAYETLNQNIMDMMRISEDNDPIQMWKDHIDAMHKHSVWLNKQQFDRLHLTTELGTDLMVGLVKNHIWTSAADMNEGDTPCYVANMPTEEVFTDPDKWRVNGIVYASRPLNLNGQLVENFSLTFKDGRCIDAKASKNLQNLLDTINQSENSHYLGEVALVSKQSPITKMEKVFFNGLIDENAASHLALGSSFPTNIVGGVNLTKEELDKLGVNDAINHNDFMWGTPDMKVVGIKEDGSETLIMEHGDFVI